MRSTGLNILVAFQEKQNFKGVCVQLTQVIKSHLKASHSLLTMLNACSVARRDMSPSNLSHDHP